MKAGALDRHIELRHRVLAASDAYGQKTESWPSAFATVWAEKRDMNGREFFSAQTVNADRTTRFRIRWRNDLVMTDRILFDGKSFDITHISEIGRHEGLEIFATATVT